MNKNYRGPAESKELSEDGPAIDQADKGSAKKGHHKKGGAKYKKGAGDYDVKKGSHDHPHSGPGRMGYTQNFGPARQNSYSKGAAKVAKIMGKGAYKKGAADAGLSLIHISEPTRPY